MHRVVLIIASHFPPRLAAGVHRTLRFVRYLPEMDWGVHVLTLMPQCYEEGVLRDDALSQRVPREVVVHRTRAVHPVEWLDRTQRLLLPRRRFDVGAHANANGSAGDSTAGWFQRLKEAVALSLTTPDPMIGWVPFAFRRGKRVIRKHAIDVIYSSGPPWTNHLIGLRLRRATGRPWVADFRDPWVGAEGESRLGGDDWEWRKHQRLEREVVAAAECVVVNTPRSRDDMLARYSGLPTQKFVVIPNGYDPADGTHSAPAPGAGMGRFVMAHAGSFYGKRSVLSLFEALSRLCRAEKIPHDRIELQLFGAVRDGRSSNEQRRVLELGLEEVVRLLPPIPHQECLKRLAAADVLLLVQVGAPLCVPGKVFEYIALGKPVLTLASEGATADLVREEHLGPCVDPDDVTAIEGALIDLHSRFAAGRPLPGASPEIRARYDGRRLTAELDGVLRRTLAHGELR